MNDSSFIKFLWSIFLQSSAKFWCLQQIANINIDPRMQKCRYLHGRITWSLEPGTLSVNYITTMSIQPAYGGVIIHYIIIHFEFKKINPLRPNNWKGHH